MRADLHDPDALAAALGVPLDTARRLLAWMEDSGSRADITAPILSRGPSAATFASRRGQPELSIGATFLVDEPEAPPAEAPATPEERYEDLGLLGRGGMGEVRRVFDRQLGRTVAMKVLRPEAAGAGRFLEEARVIARLQHPGVLPVHEIGALADGRVYFTMQEIRGRTLRDHIQEVHDGSAPDAWRSSREGWTFRRLVDAFLGVCETVAYAHLERVVHRDLKPRNVMVGAHGEVMVVDWGLARTAGTNPAEGGLVGTPAFLPPELLETPPPPVDPRADVYALGAILYNLLVGTPPFDAPDAAAVLRLVRRGPSPVPRSTRPLPDELVDLCVRCLDRDPRQRPGDAAPVADAVRTWLDGARQRDHAVALVERARAMLPEAAGARRVAEELEAAAGEELATLAPDAPEEARYAAWARLDDARALRLGADTRESEAELTLQGALSLDPTLADAHAELAARSMARHAEAERQRDASRAAEALVRLERHLASLPARHPDVPRLRGYVSGTGAVTLYTDPPGAEVRLYRVVERHRRRVLEPSGTLGRTPLVAAPLGFGAWVLELLREGFEPVRYPVRVGRGEHWTGVPPGEAVPMPIALPRRGTLGPDDRYVPAGWTWVGGDPVAFGSAARRQLWVDGFVLRRFPVTNAELLGFLDALVAEGREGDALRWAPRERAGTVGAQGALIYGRGADGRFELRADADGDVWRPAEPAMMVDWWGARAFAAWVAGREGLPWRLPGEWEWEKAARGVDERPYPWGDAFDPSRACTRLSHGGRPNPADVDSFPVDESVYGVRGLGGNVRDWCLDAFVEVPPPDRSRVRVPDDDDPGLPRVNRGGFWLGNERDARAADRHSHFPTHRASELGFRLARSWPG